MKFEEWEKKVKQIIFVSATPADYEKAHSQVTAEQIIRPTGLLDPKIVVKPTDGQIEDLTKNIHEVVESGERVLVTTLTKKMAEELTAYLTEKDIKVRYMHSDIEALDRLEIIRDLRLGKFDVLVGINLLRDGLDIPEVSLVTILDADKEGFLRSERSLIQVIGRAARNEHGKVIMYASKITDSMKASIDETNRRRAIQEQYNEEHHITPKTIIKEIRMPLKIKDTVVNKNKNGKMTRSEKERYIKDIEKQMREAAKNYEFEKAAELRDILFELKGE